MLPTGEDYLIDTIVSDTTTSKWKDTTYLGQIGVQGGIIVIRCNIILIKLMGHGQYMLTPHHIMYHILKLAHAHSVQFVVPLAPEVQVLDIRIKN